MGLESCLCESELANVIRPLTNQNVSAYLACLDWNEMFQKLFPYLDL